MNILVSNDDGIMTEGIKSLVRALAACGNVYVVAPHSQRSASSHALSVNGEITLRQKDFEYAQRAYECDGTPADCVTSASIAQHTVVVKKIFNDCMPVCMSVF